MLETVIAAIAALVVGLAVGALAVRLAMGSRNRAAVAGSKISQASLKAWKPSASRTSDHM